MQPRLYRSNNDRMLLGVCGGVAERLDLDPSLVRLALALLLLTGSGFVLYAIAALIIPRRPELGAHSANYALEPARSRAISRRS